MSKIRGYMVVLHDVQDGTQTKQNVIDLIMAQDPEQVVVAQEPSPEEGKIHIHVFYRYKSPRHFSTNLKLWCIWWKSGRAHVDQMKGTMAQACRYLMADFTKKDKHTDPDPFFYPSIAIAKSPAERAEEWMDWFISDGPTSEKYESHAQSWLKAFGENFRTTGRLQAV